MADFVFDRFLSGQMAGAGDRVDLTGDTIMVMLVSGSYIPSQQNDNVTGDIDVGGYSTESFGTNYTGKGVELTSKTLTTVGTENARTGVFDAADVSWLNSTITASGALIYKSGTTANLIGFVDFADNKSSSAGTFSITWDAGGILHFRQGS